MTAPDRRRRRVRGLAWRIRYALTGGPTWTLADEFDYRDAVRERWTP